MRPQRYIALSLTEPHMSHSMPLAGQVVLFIARTAAALIGTRRPMVHTTLTDDECETRGVPLESTEPAVFVQQVPSIPWWRLDAWMESDGGAGHCLRFDAFGWSAEVYYRPRAAVVA